MTGAGEIPAGAAVREHRLLIPGVMIPRVLDGSKTQHRIPIRPQPLARNRGWWDWGYKYGAPKATSPRTSFWHAETWAKESGSAPIDDYCPLGRPGDRLWVPETWAVVHDDDTMPEAQALEEAREQMPWASIAYREQAIGGYAASHLRRWLSSASMPRWASRITLEITEVRVQRLQEISEEDAQAEGVYNDHSTPDGWGFEATCGNVYRRNFARSWDSINGKKAPWSSNPWPWCLSFRRITEDAGR